MKKSLKYIIAIFLIIIVAIITGIFYYSHTNAPSSNTQHPTQQFDNLDIVKINNSMITQQDNQIYKVAVDSNNVDKCDEMSDDNQQNLCVKLLAIKLKNNQLCDKIINKEVAEECNDRVTFEIAIQNKDLELCKVIKEENLNSSCAVNIISQNQYKEPDCEKLEDSKQKDLCLGHVLYEEATAKNDISLCQKIPGEGNNTECLYSIISEYDNLSYCRILPEELQQICLQIVARRLAYEKKDKSLCDQMIDDAAKDECKESVDEILDIDNDGLINSQEKIYGTDQNNPDTDGDGHSDGEEVKNGFNPKGEGKMP